VKEVISRDWVSKMLRFLEKYNSVKSWHFCNFDHVKTPSKAWLFHFSDSSFLAWVVFFLALWAKIHLFCFEIQFEDFFFFSRPRMTVFKKYSITTGFSIWPEVEFCIWNQVWIFLLDSTHYKNEIIFEFLMFNSYWRISRAGAGPISGKLIQNRAFSRKMKFNKFRSMAQTDFWKTHPNMDEFSRNRSNSCPDISKKLNRYSQNITGWIFQKSV